MEEERVDYRAIFLLLGIGILIVVVMVFRSFNQTKDQKNTVSDKQSDVAKVAIVSKKKTGYIKINPRNGFSYKVGDTLSLLVKADSLGNDVSGFDILIGYSQDAFSLTGVSDLSTMFKSYPLKKNNLLIVTGTKKLQVNSNSVLKGEDIVEVNLACLKKGQYSFTLLTTSDKEKTQMVNAESKIVYPDLNQIQIKVE
ncbi:hypothetical protein GYA28_03360 [Candidatus Roizmanbacteria bacterium]|jgi:hypothetical protein|nr:hypothetical protein [Candidatus Roizmanbacteria bacterium]